MNTKKLFSLILTVCMLFSMASCGQPGTPSPPDSTPPDGANTTNNGQNQSSEFPLEKPITILTYWPAGVRILWLDCSPLWRQAFLISV